MYVCESTGIFQLINRLNLAKMFTSIYPLNF